MVSPMARLMPRMTPVPMPLRLAGTSTWRRVSQRVAPRARDPSRSSRGTMARASSDMEVMVGMAIKASISEA